jgi:hypothetical protein
MSEGGITGSLSRLAAGLAVLFLACGEPAGTPTAPQTPPSTLIGAPTSTGTAGSTSDDSDDSNSDTSDDEGKLLRCPTDVTQSVTGVINPAEGETVSVGGYSVTLTLAPGFINTLGSVPVTLTVPASRYDEVNVTVAGLEHLTFPPGTSATIVIDYSRCGSPKAAKRTLAAWNIDPQTKELLESMGGTDDKQAETVTFSTGHLSSYAIAF